MADLLPDDLPWRAVGRITFGYRHTATGGLAQAGDDLGQLPLSVAGHPGHSKDLSLSNGEGDVLQGWKPLVVQRPQPLDLQNSLAQFDWLLLHAEEHLPADHHAGQFLLAGLSGVH